MNYLSINTIKVLNQRYLKKDDNRKIIETPLEMFRRVASAVAKAERNFVKAQKVREYEESFYCLMRELKFMPNSPTLMNAGTQMGQLSACFVLPLEDSMDDIFSALKNMALIHQTGGGTGFNFSHLRPKGDLVYSTKGEASGPVSFMSIFDKATGVVVQGGRRRGANMGILRCDHPDIVEFIEAKKKRGAFPNFNLSVALTDEFMSAYYKNTRYNLVNPRTKKVTSRVKARDIFNLIVNAAWLTGEPGVVFIDEINRRQPTPLLGKIEATNPCGELPLLPYESCNLGSINLSRFVKLGGIDWKQLRDAVHLGVRFLDDVIEVNNFPLEEIKSITQANRKIGLGIMGFADTLILLGIPYNSQEAVDFASRLMRFIRGESLSASVSLARERGVFPNFRRSIYYRKNLRLRNATLNTIAPTGTISIIASCSSGIEPLFAISFIRNVLSGARLLETNRYFEEIAKKKGFFSRQLMIKIARDGSLRGIRGIPQEVKRIFVTAFDIEPMWHLKIQAAFQRYTDNSVSKTINLPLQASVEEVRNIYLTSHRLKCKGITVYRYGAKQSQVLSFRTPRRRQREVISAESEYSGGCVGRLCTF